MSLGDSERGTAQQSLGNNRAHPEPARSQRHSQYAFTIKSENKGLALSVLGFVCPGSAQNPWKPPTSAHPETSRGSGPSDSICPVTGPAGPQCPAPISAPSVLVGAGVLAHPSKPAFSRSLPVPTGWEVWPPQLAAPSSQQGVNTVQGRCCCLFKREEGRHSVNPRAPRASPPHTIWNIINETTLWAQIGSHFQGEGVAWGEGTLNPWRTLLLVEGHTPDAFKGILVALPHPPPPTNRQTQTPPLTEGNTGD